MEYFLMIIILISATLFIFGIESLRAPYTKERLIRTASIVMIQIICTGGIYGVTKSIMTPLYARVVAMEAVISICLLIFLCIAFWKYRKQS